MKTLNLNQKVKIPLPKLKLLRSEQHFSLRSLLAFALIFAALGAYFILRSLAATPVVATLQAEAMTKPAGASTINDSSASGGQAVRLSQTGSLTGSVALPSTSSATSLSLTVKGSKCKGTWPTVSLSLDGNAVLTTRTVTSSGWTSYTITTNLAASSTHSLSIAANVGRCSYLYVDVTTFYGPTPAVTPPPTISFDASPLTVVAGQASTLTWSSSNTTSCSASDGWSGSQPTSGTASTGALNTTTTYTLTCTGSGGTAGKRVTVTVGPTSTSGDKLTWAPPGYPTYTGYTTVQLQDTGQICPSLSGQNTSQPQSCYLDKTKDYILKLNNRHTGPDPSVSVIGGRNVVIIGGQVTVDLSLIPDSPTTSYRAMIFKEQTGIVHVEGVNITGAAHSCFAFDSTQAIYQVQNIRCIGPYMWKENFNNPHSSIFITWRSPQEIRLDKDTFDYDNTGLAIYREQQPDGTFTYPKQVTIKRVNIRNTSNSYCSNITKPIGHITVSHQKLTRIDIDRLYTETGWGVATWSDCPNPGSYHYRIWDAWFQYDGATQYTPTLTKSGDGLSQGSYMDFINPSSDNVWGVNGAYARVYAGIPSGGDYVPAGLTGPSYVSPGYQ